MQIFSNVFNFVFYIFVIVSALIIIAHFVWDLKCSRISYVHKLKTNIKWVLVFVTQIIVIILSYTFSIDSKYYSVDIKSLSENSTYINEFTFRRHTQYLIKLNISIKDTLSGNMYGLFITDTSQSHTYKQSKAPSIEYFVVAGSDTLFSLLKSKHIFRDHRNTDTVSIYLGSFKTRSSLPCKILVKTNNLLNDEIGKGIRVFAHIHHYDWISRFYLAGIVITISVVFLFVLCIRIIVMLIEGIGKRKKENAPPKN